MKQLNEMNLSFAEIIACDIANEIIDLNKDNKTSDKYNTEVFELLNHNNNLPFYLSDNIDAYEQIDETNVKIKEDYHYYVLYLDRLPICIISTNLSNEETNRWSYNIYSLNDQQAINIIDGNKYCLLSALDYGLYLIDDKNNYYIVSYPMPADRDISQTLTDLNINVGNITKNILDIELLNKKDIEVNIKQYDYNVINESDLTIIKEYLKNNEEHLLGCHLIGPIPRYQYYFASLDNIVVCDFDKENDSYLFELIKDNKCEGLLYYDSFEGEDGIAVNDIKINDNHSYFVDLADVGYVFEDNIISDEQSYSLIDKLVIKQIQKKIKDDKSSFNTYDLDK